MVGTKKEKKLFVIMMSIVILFNTSSCAVNEKSNLIGTEITMLPEKVIVGNEVVTNFPMYQISIIPIISKTQAYIKDLPAINELNIKGNFFAFVEVEDFYEGLNSDFPFNSFYVMDDETLIAEQDGYYVELKRIEYIDDLEYRMEFP